MDGYKICRKLRILSQNPILILTNIRTASDCIKGLKMGANEYIRKPVSLKELEVRINSLLFQTNRQLNQTSPTETTIYNYGSLNLDTLKNCVIQNKVKIQHFVIKCRFKSFSSGRFLVGKSIQQGL